MSSLRAEQRAELLEKLKRHGSRGRAEGEDAAQLPRTFHPVREHLRMLDPEVVLIVGPRGSGKTEILRALTDANLAQAVSAEAKGTRLSAPGNTHWLKGYPLDREGFDAGGLRRFIDRHPQSADAIQGLWFAYLVRLLGQHLRGAGATLEAVLDAPGGAAQEVYDAWRNAEDAPLLALDQLDRRLEREGGHLFVGYDELDVLGGSDWDAMAIAVRGLVAFWAAYARRWRRIRPKIFLRSDLFERFATSGGADLAKLAAGRIELSWSDRQLYEMLLRRIANMSEDLGKYVREANPKIAWRKHETLGWIPTLGKWTDARPVIERMVGPYMGANSHKGMSFRWPLAHVRDGHGRAVPRPLVRLFEEAAVIEAASPNAVGGRRILHPMSLRRAIDRVSTEHVEHARDEWKWIDELKRRLKGLLVPAERSDVEKALGGEPWGTPRPYDDPREFLDYTVEVGILRERPDGRIDAPDLFLYGLGLKRKGGVRRK